MRRVSEQEYSVMHIYRSGTALDSPKRREMARVRVDTEDEKEKPDFSAMFHTAIANLV